MNKSALWYMRPGDTLDGLRFCADRPECSLVAWTNYMPRDIFWTIKKMLELECAKAHAEPNIRLWHSV